MNAPLLAMIEADDDLRAAAVIEVISLPGDRTKGLRPEVGEAMAARR